jgi:SlyX protein
LTDSRLEQIEVKLAYQEDTIRELGDVIYRQQQLIDALQQLCRQLEERIASIADPGPPVPAEDETPPHY